MERKWSIILFFGNYRFISVNLRSKFGEIADQIRRNCKVNLAGLLTKPGRIGFRNDTIWHANGVQRSSRRSSFDKRKIMFYPVLDKEWVHRIKISVTR